MLRGVNTWLEANRWAGDAVVASGLLLVALLAHGAERDAHSLLMSVLLICPLFARRSRPRTVVVLVAGLCLLQLLVLPAPVVGDAAAPLAVHTVTAHVRDRRWGGCAFAAALVGAVLGAARWADSWVASEQFVLLFGACAAAVTSAYLLGARQRDQRERVEEQLAALHERNRLLAVERDQRSAVVAAAERARIARELHDIVAHSLSVIVVQANGAAAAVTAAPESAADLAPKVLNTIADTSRDALTEMRRMVAVLRSGGDPLAAGHSRPAEDYAPAPGAADIPDLVAQVSTAAIPVTLSERGAATELPSTTDLTLYRVVQESLTNVIKHGGPAARAEVTIDYRDTQVLVEIVDDGRGAAAAPDGSADGHGLIGMRERVMLQGGTMHAGPRLGGGFAVQVALPVAAARTAARSGGLPTGGTA